MTGNVDLNYLLAALDDVVSLHALDGRLIHVSSACGRLTGWEPFELAGQTGIDLVHPDDRARVLGRVRDLVAGVPVPETEWRCLRRSGSPVWVSTAARLVRAEAGQPAQIVARSIDSTARKEAEAGLRRDEKLEAVGRLAGGIAHEFNNLLTIISGYGEFLLEANPAGTPFHQPLAEIHRAAERAAALTRQLLAVSCRQMLAPITIDLNQFLRRLKSDFERALGASNRLHLELASDLWQLRADPVQLEHALLEFAHNARAAMPTTGGDLILATANVSVEASASPRPSRLPPGSYVRLTVRDTGSGMDAFTLTHAFDPFFTTKPVGAGRGLGLAMVHGIIKQTGGSIEAESAPGMGTCFTIHLPALPEAPPAAIASGTRTVLLVETDPAVRHLAAQVLRNEGYEVLEAGSGTEALRLYERHPEPIHLLLTGLSLPDMSGSELAGKLLPRSLRLQLLFVTGFSTEKSLHREPLHGRQPRFLPKPFRPADLLEMVRETLEAVK